MFLNNKYYKWYQKLTSKRDRVLDCYTEKHHIIPKSLGGNDSKENIIVLTTREHFIAHLLLTKCTTGKSRTKMIFACVMMTNKIGFNNFNSYNYSLLRDEYSESLKTENVGINNPMFGVPRTQEQKELQSQFMKCNNPMFNKYTVDKIKQAKLGTINCFDTIEQKFVRVQAVVYHSNKERYKNNNSKEAKEFKLKGVA